ncbi:MAG: GxxExxY protein [Flavobacteriaceae bacterium]|tara:strand:- start:4 stop:381 length:378 start_codon:yes stop_codon:yes gene_type:complete
MTENEIARVIVDKCYHIHVALGPGLLESVYEEVLYYELNQEGLNIKRQQDLPVFYKSLKMDVGFRADLIVENKVIIELKSVEKIVPVHQKQLLTYLKISELKLGLLVNFNDALIKNGITRIVNRL